MTGRHTAKAGGIPRTRALIAWRRPGVLLFLAAFLLPALIFAFSAWVSYHDAIRTAETRAERTARVLEEHVSKVFESHRLVIQHVRDRLRFVDWSKEEDRADLHQMLRALQNELDQVATITVVDADGRMKASGRTYPADRTVSFADRDWFKMLRAGARGTVISRSYKGRQSGQPVFNIAVGLRQPSGAFDGAIAVSVDRSYFEAFYREVEPDFDHVVTLVRDDGEILAQTPAAALTHLPDHSRFMTEMLRSPVGHYIGQSMIDRLERVFAYRKIAGYPIYVRFGIATEAVLAPWWRTLLQYGLVSLFSSMALVVASWLVVRQSHREGLARRRWQETAAALEKEVAERERVDAQLRQLQKMEAIGRLTGGIAHDFNNLLTAVLGNLELAARRIDDARVARLIGNASDGAQRAAALTGRLLAFSRQQPLQPKRVGLNELVSGMGDLLHVTLGESVALSMELDAEVWPVEIDVSQLENAILNLAVNARDAMPKGGTLFVATGNVTIAAGSDAGRPGEVEPGSYSTVTIRDTGEGMSPDVLAQVFEPFFTTKPVGKGTGLGLSQVYGFARQSGGHVLIRSTVGEGTSIQMFLPRASDVDVGEPAVPNTGAAQEARAQGETILVVEDETMVRAFAASVLRDAGYKVVQAADGPSALALLERTPDVALLFTDVVLKGPMDGRALGHAVSRRKQLPVLFTSGYSRDAIIQDGRLAPGVELLQKPFTSADLTARVRALLDAAVAPDRNKVAV